MLNISLQPEYVLSINGFLITNTFLTSLLTTGLLVGLATLYYCFRNYDENQHWFLKLWHIILYELLRFTDAMTGSRTLSRRLLPLLATLFIFIVTTNLLALLPGFLGSFFVETESGPVSLFRSPNSDLTTTLALALVAVMAIQYFSLRTLGFLNYLKRFINLRGIIPFVLGLFELLSESLRVLSFSFRLFGNVFAGEVLLLVIASLVPWLLPVPFMLLEVFISLIQAFIFCVLTVVFIRISVAKHPDTIA